MQLPTESIERIRSPRQLVSAATMDFLDAPEGRNCCRGQTGKRCTLSHDIAVSAQHDRATRVPFGFYKSEQARLSRQRLYPLTVFYSTYSAIVSVLAARSAHPWVALLSYWAGFPAWSVVEYLFRRYVLHDRFPTTEGIIKRFLHERLDPRHCEHHESPFDGAHISGGLEDLLPLFAVAAPASFIFPVFTTPALLAGVVQSYVAEEWIRHWLHFYNFRIPLFRRLKR